MSERSRATLKSASKMFVYLALFTAATQISDAESLDLINWKALGLIVLTSAIKGTLTWLTTGEKP